MSYVKYPRLDKDNIPVCLNYDRIKLQKKYKKLNKILTKKEELAILKKIDCGFNLCPVCYACECIHTPKGIKECSYLAMYIW